MATASTGWIILQFSIRAHETLPLATFWLFRVYHENQSTEHFMSPIALKTSGYLHGTCKSFLFLWLDWRLGEASCVVTLLAQSDPKPNFYIALFCHCFFLNIILPHNFIFNIQVFSKKSNNTEVLNSTFKRIFKFPVLPVEGIIPCSFWVQNNPKETNLF